MFVFHKTSFDEADRLQKWYESPAVHRWVPIDEYAAYLRAVSNLKDYYLYSVYDKETLIATIAVEVCVKTASICLVVDPALHGRGIGARVLLDMQCKTQELFGNINEYIAGIFPGNIASIKCFEKAGFGKKKKGNDGEDIYSCVVRKGKMLAYTYVENGRFELLNKKIPVLQDDRDAIVRVTLSSICSSDLHIKHGEVPRAVPGITVGHEMVGVVEEVGSAVTHVKRGDRVTVNVETFCGECYFCRRGFVNNCVHPLGGWALGCRIDGGQAEYVRVPMADHGLNLIPDCVTDEQALLVGDVLATGYWATKISEITEDDTVLLIGAGPTGLCTLLCVLLKHPKRIIVCETDEQRIAFVKAHYPSVLVCKPEDAEAFVRNNSEHGGADVVMEIAGAKDTFALAWKCARPNAIVTIVALYEENQMLPLPDMYGKNLVFKTGGVDGCDCDETLRLIAEGLIDTTPLLTHRFKLSEIEDAYRLFENKEDSVIKIAICP